MATLHIESTGTGYFGWNVTSGDTYELALPPGTASTEGSREVLRVLEWVQQQLAIYGAPVAFSYRFTQSPADKAVIALDELWSALEYGHTGDDLEDAYETVRAACLQVKS